MKSGIVSADHITAVDELEHLNDFLPRTNKALGQTAARFLDNKRTSDAVARSLHGVSVDGFGSIISGSTRAGGAIGSRLLPGLDVAKDKATGLGRALDYAGQKRSGAIDIDTSAAQARADHLLATLNNINHLSALHAAGVGPAAPSAPSGKVAPRIAPRRSQRQPVSFSFEGREMRGYVDERIASDNDLRDEQRRAGRR